MYYYMILPQKIVSFSINKNELKIIFLKNCNRHKGVSQAHVIRSIFKKLKATEKFIQHRAVKTFSTTKFEPLILSHTAFLHFQKCEL